MTAITVDTSTMKQGTELFDQIKTTYAKCTERLIPVASHFVANEEQVMATVTITAGIAAMILQGPATTFGFAAGFFVNVAPDFFDEDLRKKLNEYINETSESLESRVRDLAQYLSSDLESSEDKVSQTAQKVIGFIAGVGLLTYLCPWFLAKPACALLGAAMGNAVHDKFYDDLYAEAKGQTDLSVQ